MKAKTILVVGELIVQFKDTEFFKYYFAHEPSEINVYSDYDGSLYFASEYGWVRIDMVLWRCQFDKNLLAEQRVLETILKSNVICVNNVKSCLYYGHSSIMHQTILELGLPTVSKVRFYGQKAPYMADVDHIMKVLKVGEWHGGYGKALVINENMYIDTIDIAVLLKESITLEEYIPYDRDIRALYIDGYILLYERVPSIWKANVSPKKVVSVSSESVPKVVIDGTKILAEKTNSDIIGVDWILSKEDQNWYVLEGNMAPGLDDQESYDLLAKLIYKKFE